MPWERLFEQIEADLAAAEADEHRLDVAERTRIEWSRVSLVDRLEASDVVTVRMVTGTRVGGRIAEVGVDWMALDTAGRGPDCLVLLPAISWIEHVAQRVEPSRTELAVRLEVRSFLRTLARDRVEVRLCLREGTMAGRIDRVGADHLDLTVNAGAELQHTLPFSAIALVRWSGAISR